MLGHISLYVKDFQKGKDFYNKVLPLLGYHLDKDFEGAAGFMAEGNTDFWLMGSGEPIHKQHVAFVAKDEKTVHEFYATALAAGGKDNGPPGPRPNYGPNYYAAFVLDPEGNNIEGVFWG